MGNQPIIGQLRPADEMLEALKSVSIDVTLCKHFYPAFLLYADQSMSAEALFSIFLQEVNRYKEHANNVFDVVMLLVFEDAFLRALTADEQLAQAAIAISKTRFGHTNT